MPIIAGDIKKYLSGGAANANTNAALGGAISSVEITDDSVSNLFDTVSQAESTAGDTEYRAFFVKNTHATLTYQDVVVYLSSNTPSADTTVAIALADEAVGVSTIETIVDESTAPSGPSFSSPATVGAGLAIGDMAPGEMKGIWVRWTVTAGAESVLDEVSITFSGATDA